MHFNFYLIKKLHNIYYANYAYTSLYHKKNIKNKNPTSTV